MLSLFFLNCQYLQYKCKILYSSASCFYYHPLYVLLLWGCWASLDKRLKLGQLILFLSLTYISDWTSSCCCYPFVYLYLAFCPVPTFRTFFVSVSLEIHPNTFILCKWMCFTVYLDSLQRPPSTSFILQITLSFQL